MSAGKINSDMAKQAALADKVIFKRDYGCPGTAPELDRCNRLVQANTVMEDLRIHPEWRHGRGAGLNPAGQFETVSDMSFDDGWESEAELPPLKTRVQVEKARRIITSNTSPNICYDRSINPYRGCEHGCIYCYARPSHAYMGLSAGLDFETRLFAKPDAAQLLQKELSKPGYQPRLIAIGSNTDPYQPVEKKWRIMRDILSVLYETRHPVSIVTKSALILRDMDLLAAMAEKNLVQVALSVTTLDARLARAMEPRAATPPSRYRHACRARGSGSGYGCSGYTGHE